MTDDFGFLESLLAAMTLDEKVGQLCLYSASVTIEGGGPTNPVFSFRPPEDRLDDIRAGRVCGLFNGYGADYVNTLQRMAVEESRLGIPLIFGADVIHGFETCFPVPLAEAASFDTGLAGRVASAVAAEAAACGIHWTFAPGADVCRDARWGRVVETAGEDPLLASRFAVARLEGFQGDDLTDPTRVMATVKHFAAYGAAEGGLDYNTADVSRAALHAVHLPPFRAAAEAGVGAVMTAFNDVDGVPATANRYLLTDVLRSDWRFEGVVVSDYGSDLELINHGVAATPRDAARMCFRAGLDMSMQSGIYADHLADLVRAGEVDGRELDRSVMRVLRMKARLGLFENPYRGLGAARPATSNRTLAREAARKSMVLLKNARVLPLASGSRIALIGPFARENRHLNGPWSLFADNRRSINLHDGLQAALGREQVFTAPGCRLAEAIPGGVDAALELARGCDLILLALGEGENMSGESRSRADLRLPDAQLALAEALATLGKPMVVLLRTGRPLAIGGLADLADALLVTWFLGSETGSAVADILTGAASPSGRLPISFPRHPGQTPIYYGRKTTGRPPDPDRAAPFRARFIDVAPGPLFPFGYGQTYGDVGYGPTRLDREEMEAGGTLRVFCRLTERRGVSCVETPQLYIHDLVARETRPRRELKDFRKVELAANGSVEVMFELAYNDLLFPDPRGVRCIDPGEFDVWIAPDAESGEPGRFTLTAGR